MRSYKLQGAFLLCLLISQVIAQDMYETDNCECDCDCNVPDNGGQSKPDQGNSVDPNKDKNTNSTVIGQSRDFKAWFAKMDKDPWGKFGLPVILQGINGGITQKNADKWLDDISLAAKKYPKFCNSGNEATDKKEFAAFMTIVGAETSFDPSNGFPCTKEIGCPNCQACSYNTKGQECLSDPNKQYNGRGPLQLSWNYNYENFSKNYFGNDSLLQNPNLLVKDEATCWASAIWFWMTEQGYGGWCMPQAGWNSRDTCDAQCPNGPASCKNSACTNSHWLTPGRKSPHDAIIGEGGIGQVINIINGGYDCCPSTTYFSNFGHTLHRVQWYAEILQKWGQPLPWNTLTTVPIKECPAAQDTIDCSRLTSSNCYWNCCNKK